MQSDRQEELEKLSTQQLDQMLQAQLQQEDADPAEVKRILGVLKEREKDMPVEIGDTERLAWQRYKAREKECVDKPARKRSRILRVACIAAIFCVLTVAAAYEVEAEGLWGRLVRWTDSVIEFFSPDHASGGQKEYEFRTDHPGLQQVYDTVTELGVEEPVVPMWLPEGYALIFCQDMITDNQKTLMTAFQNGEKVINYNVSVCSEGVLSQYQKDETELKLVEFGDVNHYIVKNNDKWVAVWTKDNIECSISVDCQEDELYKILRSVYDKEEAT